MRLALTDLALRKLAPPDDGQLRIFDTNLPAFGITVGRRTKTFFVIKGSDRKLTTLGRYPEISLKDARDAAKLHLATKAAERGKSALTEAVQDFIKDAEGRLRPASVHFYRSMLREAPQIDVRDATRKTLPLRSPHHIRAYKVLLNWCIGEGLIDRNPIHHLSVETVRRTRVLSDDELRAIWHYEDGRFSTIVRLLILTGQLLGEVCSINDNWLSGDTCTIPADYAKNGHAHTFPFNLLTAQHLKRLEPFNGFSKSKKRMDEALDLPPWRLHDLRRTFATKHAEIGTPLPVVEKLLNHVSGSFGGIVSVYQKYQYLKEMRVAASHYEQHLWELLHADQTNRSR